MKARDINLGQYPSPSDFPVVCFKSAYDDASGATSFEMNHECDGKSENIDIKWWIDSVEVDAKDFNLWVPLSEIRKAVK